MTDEPNVYFGLVARALGGWTTANNVKAAALREGAGHVLVAAALMAVAYEIRRLRWSIEGTK